METSSKVMRHDKEMVCSFRAIPIWPVGCNELNGTSHHSGRFKGKRKPIRREIASCVHRNIKPISFLRIKCSNWAGQKKPLHIDLSSKHVVETSRVFLKYLLVIFAWKLINKDFQSSHWIIFQYITSTT